jgi:hypothetical protein
LDGSGFLQLIETAFAPFLGALDFVPDGTKISGNHFSARFAGPNHAVSISYEPGTNFLSVMVPHRGYERLSDIDDRQKTPRLSDLNARFDPAVSSEDCVSNEEHFRNIVVRDDAERLLLKAAKELRLVLPKYLTTH